MKTLLEMNIEHPNVIIIMSEKAAKDTATKKAAEDVVKREAADNVAKDAENEAIKAVEDAARESAFAEAALTKDSYIVLVIFMHCNQKASLRSL
jgi:hypothetical protein